MIVKLIALLLITLKTSRCSLIIDNAYQKGLYLSDYCPNMKYCREGSHVMCMFYDPNNVIGPRCYNAVNITITADLANQLLDVSNTIRSKIANGKETGKDGVLLPRGYGIFRLKWDNELATFAQVLANQCVLRHDMCRATKRFPNPSQTAGLVRFTFPDWHPMSKVKGITPTPGVTSAKLVYAITQSLKSWYGHKSSVTEQMVKVYPDWSATTNQSGRLYLDMIHGPATHMGCGISGYSEYVYYENHRQGIHNSIQVICNFSAGARKGTRSYDTDSPMPGQGFSSKCGCPPGSKEDSDCLCNEVKTPPLTRPEPTCPVSELSGNNCDPTLVLLPIFTMEDAPPEKLYEMAEEIKNPLKNFILQRIDNTSDAFERHGSFKHERARSSAEMLDFLHTKEGENVLWKRARNPSSPQSPASSYNTLHREKQARTVFSLLPNPNPPPPPPPPRKSPALRPAPPARLPPRPRLPPPPPPPPPPPRIPPPLPPAIHEYTTTQKNHDKPRPAASAAVRLLSKRNRPTPKPPPIRRPKTKKASLFTRVAQFQLPKRGSMPASLKVIKKDVAPRKDFSNLSKVAHDYLRNRPGYTIFSDNHEQNKPKEESKLPIEEKSQTKAVVADNGLHNVEETVINFNQYLSQKNNSNFNDKDVNIKDDNDNKLLALLDTLEREVKHIALNGSEKELFDAKIRQIYGSIVGKIAFLKFPKPILLSTVGTEPPEIDFGEAKVSEKFEPDQEEDNHAIVTEEPKQQSRYKIDQRIGRVKNYNPSIQDHKWKNKFIDSFDKKKYNDNVDIFRYGDKKPSSEGSYDHKYKEIFDPEYGYIDHRHKGNFDHQYGDIDHKHMDDLDRKYNENIYKKYNENHLEHEYKFRDNFHHQHNYDLDRKYEENEPASRSKIKYEADRAVFREFEHNSLDTQEDTTPENYIYKDIKVKHDTPDIPLITKDREKKKRTEGKHRKRVKSLNTQIHTYNEHNDPLSLERRKYYQDKLDNIRKKLRSRKNRSNNDSRNERSLRRMHTKNRESRSRSKSPADNFYMPERARFLHGF